MATLPGGTTTTSAVDPKLLHIVKRLWNQQQQDSTNNSNNINNNNNNIKKIKTLLLERHREYRRRNSTWLDTNLESCLKQVILTDKKNNSNNNINKKGTLSPSSSYNSIHTLTSQSNSFSHKDILNQIKNNKNQSSNPNSGSKRKRGVEQDRSVEIIIGEEEVDERKEDSNNNKSDQKKNFEKEDEENEERLDKWRDQILLQQEGYGGSMLNANLRDRYKSVQKEREKTAAKKSVDHDLSTVFEDPNQSDTNNKSGSSMNKNKNHDANSSEQNAAPSVPVAASSSSTPGKQIRKKKKKSLSRSSSSTSLAGPAGGVHPGSSNSGSARKSKSSSGDSLGDDMDKILGLTARPKERYSDLGGMSDTVNEIRELVDYPMLHPEVFQHLNVSPPRGVLLRGPPGCGKTHLANAMAGTLGCTYFRVSAPEIVSGMSGESEERIRRLFQAASDYAPSLIFIDEIDAIAPKRNSDNPRGMEKRIVAQLLTSMDSQIAPANNRNNAPVLVIGATNRPDAIDAALRRAGRFDREITLSVPDQAARQAILERITSQMRIVISDNNNNSSIDYAHLAKKTPGYVGADLQSLAKEAAILAMNRIFSTLKKKADDTASTMIMKESTNMDEINNSSNKKKKEEEEDVNTVTPFTAEQLEPMYITMDDFVNALDHVQPSAKREGFATVPGVTWDDVGALASIREELTLHVLEPIAHPEKFQALGLPLPAGVLLYGPPGCGKTLLAKAIAHESGTNFISVKGPELLDKYVGESERAVRTVFDRARMSSPCVVFFDELDSLCPKRGSSEGSGGGGVTERVVNQLLTEMDGLDKRHSIFVVAATNRPELIDPAMMRPGRLDKLLYVPLPTAEDRASILKALALKKVNLSSDVDLDIVARNPRLEGYSGADCAALLREAGLAVLREASTNSSIEMKIFSRHFQYAFDHVLPSVSKRDQVRYDKLASRMARARTRPLLTPEGEDTTTTQQQQSLSNDTTSATSSSQLSSPRIIQSNDDNCSGNKKQVQNIKSPSTNNYSVSSTIPTNQGDTSSIKDEN